MANTLSNLYVEKASSEHPLALWMMNEQVDYVSQITEPERQFQLFDVWDVQNAETVNVLSTAYNAPFLDSGTTKIIGSIPATPTQDIILTSKFDLSQNLIADLKTVTIGFYLYIDSNLGESVTFGYKHINDLDEVTEEFVTTNILQSDFETWKFFSTTLPAPPETAIYSRLVIKITTVEGALIGDYNFLINGLSVGQRSENFNQSSYGVTPGDMPTNIALPSSLKVIEAYPYGTSGDNGYYVSQGYNLTCQNFGVPLVFGSSNTTKIYPNIDTITEESYPSMIFPGYGFLNERGRFNNYSIEMWMRINSSSTTPKRIFGPITGTDGLYADGAFLTFKVGSDFGSHFVGEWFRPMLIHIRLMKDIVIVILNGEEVIRINYDQDTVELPSEYNEDNENQNWLGFYGYTDISPIELDTLSIYSYAIPTEVAKRRWVWGQGVTPPEQTNSSTNSITAYNDYAFANYAANYNYPDFAKFRQAFFSNVDAKSRALELPDYKLPTFSLRTNTSKDLYKDVSLISIDLEDPDDLAGLKYVTLKPNNSSTWDSQTDYIHFDELSVLNDPVESFYGVFRTSGTEVNKVLFKIFNKLTNDYFIATINNLTVTYRVRISGVLTTITTRTVVANEKFVAGANLKKISSLDITDINKIFTNQSALDVYVAGDGTSKFEGRVYRFGFDAGYNNRKVSSNYDDSGFALVTEEAATSMTDHIANYTLTTIEKYGILFEDIAVAGYWEDYAPLSYFAKSILDNDGTKNYELDSIQYNQDFPEPSSASATEVVSVWTYGQLYTKYSDPEIQTYADLNNAFYTKWDNYEDMAQNAIKSSTYNTAESMLRSYVSFQKVSDGANKNLLEFGTYAKALSSGILDPAFTEENWLDTAYEVTTGSIIYPPKSYSQLIGTAKVTTPIDFNDYAMVYHLDFRSQGIKHQPLKFKELQLASHVLERTDFTPVGSRFGVPVYYYSKSGDYYDLKAKNPITTYKKSTPYLYLNGESGWKLRGEFNSGVDRGLSIPINTSAAEKTEVSSLQMWLRYSDKEFPADPVMIFSIYHYVSGALVTYDFFMQADESGQRGKVFGVNHDTLEVLENIKYFINGQSVNNPYLSNGEWAVLGLEFPDLLAFNSRTGRLNLNGPLVYNNISYNLATNIEKDERLETRSWAELLSIRHSTISNIVADGIQVKYFTTNKLAVGDLVTITKVNPAKFNVSDAVVVEATSSYIVIDSTVTGTHISGGVASAGIWTYVEEDVPSTDNTEINPNTGLPYPTWQNVRVISQSKKFTIDPKAIYEKYTGSNRIVIDDESSGILVNPEKLNIYRDVSWSSTTKIAI